MADRNFESLSLGPNCGGCEVRAYCLGAKAAAVEMITTHSLGDVAFVQAGLDSCEGGQMEERTVYTIPDAGSAVLLIDSKIQQPRTPAFPQIGFLERVFHTVRERMTHKPVPSGVQNAISAQTIINLN